MECKRLRKICVHFTENFFPIAYERFGILAIAMLVTKTKGVNVPCSVSLTLWLHTRFFTFYALSSLLRNCLSNYIFMLTMENLNTFCFEGVVAPCCNPLTLQPEKSGGVGLIPDRTLRLERHDNRVVDSIRSALFWQSQCLVLKNSTSPSLYFHHVFTCFLSYYL